MRPQVVYISGATAQVPIPIPVVTWGMDITTSFRLGFILLGVAIVMADMNLRGFRAGLHQAVAYLAAVLGTQGFMLAVNKNCL